MVKIIKKIIKNFLNKVGYEVRWHYPELTQMSFDEIYQKYISNLISKKKPDLKIYNLKKGINNWIRECVK